MTPNCAVFASYCSFSTPVRLADGNIVMSAGVGSIVLVPHLGNARGPEIEFQRVLHVPALWCNLISVLYLVRWQNWSVLAEGDTISFHCENTLWFTAHINERNSASLEEEMQIAPSSSMVVAPAAPSKQFAAAATLPLDLELWHRRTMHHHYGGLKRAIRDKLVTGITITSLATPDPICEPCLAGKMHSDGFPSTGTITPGILDLVHSDLVTMPVRSVSGYLYWVGFHNDASSYHAVYPLKTKGEMFAAFKQYKAWAEKLTGCKIKAL